MSLKKKNKLIKSLIKKPPKKSEISDVKKFNKLINNEEMGMNRELFQRHFKFQRPSSMLSELYNTDNKEIIL